ncbi:MAG: radical SAM protein [Nanoarchaeota archaeon]|nr:radical SAM protein [Patescibacteria group bacterium]MCG2720269.1 radical SAM protein [Nanoarchaeota archaeon]
MVFRGWQKTSLNEWPGKVCSVVFLQSCNFRCSFCYNYDLVLNPKKLPLIKEKQVLNYCKKNKDLLDGVMITGGEPLKIKNQKSILRLRSGLMVSKVEPSKIKNNLLEFIKKVKKLGLKVGVETNGSNPEMIDFLIKNKLVDYLAMDVKAPLIQEKYNQMTGVKVDLKKIKKSIRIIINSNIESEFRTTVIPGLLNEDDILKIAKEIKGGKKYYLQQFQKGETLGQLPKIDVYSQKWFKEIKEKIKNLIDIELRI